MKRNYVKILLMIGVLFTISCSKDEGNETPKLILSEKILNFDAKATEKSISVVADEEWVAVGTDWIETKKEGNNLIIKVKANKTIESREGAVSVKAGSVSDFVKVVQTGLKGKVELSTEKITFSDAKEKTVIEVDANDKDWTASSDVDWLTLTEKHHKAELIIECKDNKAEEERIGIITIKVGDFNKNIEVKQLGRLFFFLPYTDFTGTREQIKVFEEARKNILNQNTVSEQLSYNTRSEMFHRMIYKFGREDDKYKMCVLYAKSVEKMKEEFDNFTTFLVNKGFEKESQFVYKNLKSYVVATITLSGYGAFVTYRAIPKQDKDYPTFKKFPYLDELPWFSSKNEDIKAWETKNGGTLDKEGSKVGIEGRDFDELHFKVDAKNDESAYFRLYGVGKPNNPSNYKEGLLLKEQYFRKISLAFFENDGEFVFTKEFLALVKKEGFVLRGGPDGDNYYTFVNGSKQLYLLVRVGKDEGKYAVDILLQKSNIKKGTKASAIKLSYFNFEDITKK